MSETHRRPNMAHLLELLTQLLLLACTVTICLARSLGSCKNAYTETAMSRLVHQNVHVSKGLTSTMLKDTQAMLVAFESCHAPT
eukprot:362750-Pelagomonas_calceolata.AAC.3